MFYLWDCRVHVYECAMWLFVCEVYINVCVGACVCVFVCDSMCVRA